MCVLRKALMTASVYIIFLCKAVFNCSVPVFYQLKAWLQRETVILLVFYDTVCFTH